MLVVYDLFIEIIVRLVLVKEGSAKAHLAELETFVMGQFDWEMISGHNKNLRLSMGNSAWLDLNPQHLICNWEHNHGARIF